MQVDTEITAYRNNFDGNGRSSLPPCPRLGKVVQLLARLLRGDNDSLARIEMWAPSVSGRMWAWNNQIHALITILACFSFPNLLPAVK